MVAYAHCLAGSGYQRENFQHAIAWMEKAVSLAPQSAAFGYVEAYLLHHVSQWKQTLGDHIGALQIAER